MKVGCFVAQWLFVTRGIYSPASVKQPLIQIGHEKVFKNRNCSYLHFCVVFYLWSFWSAVFFVIYGISLICCFGRNNGFVTPDWDLRSIKFKFILQALLPVFGKWPIFSVLCFHIYIKKEDSITSFFPILSSVLTESSLGSGLLSLIKCMCVQYLCRHGFEMLSNICVFVHTSGNVLSLGKRHKSPFTSPVTKSGGIKKIQPWLIATIFLFSLEESWWFEGGCDLWW